MKIFLAIIAIALLSVSCDNKTNAPTAFPDKSTEAKSETTNTTLSTREVDFSEQNQVYKLSSAIPEKWKVEYIPEIESLNVYDPSLPGTSLEQSQIFIRYFKANDFLTLQTVDILSREQSTIKEHPAVRYEIKKKASVANFPSQPQWRNEQHFVTDIRYSSANPTTFYVFAKNPLLANSEFEAFLNSISFK